MAKAVGISLRRGPIQRRAHDALKVAGSVECPKCGEVKLPHHVCGACGYYKDREVIDVSGAV